MEEYGQMQEWARYSSPPPQIPPGREAITRGGGPHKEGSMPDQPPSKQETTNQKILEKGG